MTRQHDFHAARTRAPFRSRWHWVVLGILCASGSIFGANEGAEQPDPALAVRSALEQAKADYETLCTRLAAESEARRQAIGSAIAANEQLRARESQLRAELEKALDESDSLQQRTAELDLALTQPRGQTAALRQEIARQATLLLERFQGSLLGAQHPNLLTQARELKDSTSVETPGPVDVLLDQLLDVFDIILDGSQDVSTFTAPIQLAGGHGKIAEVQVLRLGLLGGYYEDPVSGEAGFLLPNEGNTQLVGHNTGVTTAQRAAIASLVRNPEQGGLIPIDVTGGAGLAALQLQDTVAEWFEKGGEFMWALLAIAIVAVLLVFERSIILLVRTLGLRTQIDKVVRLVEAGQVVEAEAYCDRIGGAAGGVMKSALAHRDRDRSVIEDAVQEALLHHAPKFQARLSFIALCAAVSPLLGLLGTVSGMIGTFQAVTVFGTSDPRYMAGGISVALITTQAGLYLAIPCLLFRGALGAVAESALGRLEAGAMSVVLALLCAREPVPHRPPAASPPSNDATMKTRSSRTVAVTELNAPSAPAGKPMPKAKGHERFPSADDSEIPLAELESVDTSEEERRR
ncbi:MAG: MotA/TolQ/ExbB proton channel family protein [Planctomycetota bacterium]